MKLRERVERARAAARFAKVVDNGGTVKVYVPGTDCVDHLVLIRRNFAENKMTVECNIVAGQSLLRCPGNHIAKTMCYHSMAGLIALGETKKRQVAFCSNFDDARTRANLGGKVYRIEVFGRKVGLWIVVSDQS